MDTVIRALVIYLFLLVLFRIAGRRALTNMTTFDLVLTLIISEAVQQALVDTDDSLTGALLLVITLIGADIGLSLLKQRSQKIEKLVEGTPIVLVEEGRPHRDRMQRERVAEEDILSSARSRHGLTGMDDVRYAVLETGGEISIVPNRKR